MLIFSELWRFYQPLLSIIPKLFLPESSLKDVLFLSILNFCTFIFFFLNLLASLIDRELEKSPLAGEFVADFIVTAFRLD